VDEQLFSPPNVIKGQFPVSRSRETRRHPDAGAPLETTIELVEKARHGNQDAWEVLVARYRGPLKRFAQARLAQQGQGFVDTDDVVQEVTINVFRRLHRIELRFPGALLAYLRRSVANRVADEHRRTMRQGLVASLPEELPDPQQSPLDLTMDNEKLRLYRTALTTLAADDRLAIVMRLERGASYEDIAARLGKPTPNAARVAVARAMYRLAKRMEPALTAARQAAADDDDDPPAAARVAGRR
jgi:RNA polymerase sigma-70 factor (ECF subfamily)